MPNLADQLAQHTRKAVLYRRLDGNRVECFACGHRCPIPSGFSGVCKVRFNTHGKLYAPYGYVNAVATDPIEKKPFFHALPGAQALSFGMLGCNFHCPYCQNWYSAQALRDVRAPLDFTPATPRELVRRALQSGASAVVSTYNEPLITAEWTAAIFREAKAAGLTTGLVSNGNATPEVLDFLRPVTDLFKVDLKSFDDRRYHALGARLRPILDSIARIHSLGFWLEVVTLVVPGFNDSDAELRAAADFLAGLSPDIPWHVTAFHPDYKMSDVQPTSAATLLRAAAIGRAAGLRFVYAGNLPGRVGELENTVCPGCGETVIERFGFRVVRDRVRDRGRCPDCSAAIPGVWTGAAAHSRDALVYNRCG
jgi:pyruvate formate lyase activating enzyme